MAIQGLLLDFDGTLLDSEPWHHRAWNEVLREHQIQLTEAQYMSLIVGHATAHCAGIVNRHFGTDFEAKWLEDAVDAQVNEWFQSRPLPENPGVAELLRWMAIRSSRPLLDNVCVAIASIFFGLLLSTDCPLVDGAL